MNNLIILISSSSTLVCCVLPSLLVTLGLGASLVNLIDTFPFLITISEYKFTIFIITAIILIFNYKLMNNKKQCPIGELEDNCQELSSVSNKILKFSIGIYLFSLLINIFFWITGPMRIWLINNGYLS